LAEEHRDEADLELVEDAGSERELRGPVKNGCGHGVSFLRGSIYLSVE